MNDSRPSQKKLGAVCKQLDMVVFHLIFAEGFINDMLTIQVLKEGAEFDVQMDVMKRSSIKSMLDFIYCMFTPMMEAKNVKLSTQIVNQLDMPEQFKTKRDQTDQLLIGDVARRKEP